MRIRKGDTVQIIAGRDHGKRGVVENFQPETNRVVVAGINIRTHHIKPTRTQPKGGIIQVPAPLYRANVIVVCPHCEKLTRGKMIIDGSAKHRACTFCQSTLDSK